MTKRHVRVRIALILIGLIAVGWIAVGWMKDRECQEWQARWRKVGPSAQGGIFAYVGLTPHRRLLAAKPEGCPIPK